MYVVGTLGSAPIAKLEDAAVHIGNLYTMDSKRKVTLRRDKLTISNGLGWTRDNKTMFYIDSAVNKVWAYDFDKETGNISMTYIRTATPGNIPSDMCAQIRFRSDCAFAQSGLNLHWALFRQPRIESFFMRTTKILIRLSECAG